MNVECVTVGPIQTNCYLVEDGGEVLVVDPGGQAERILDALAGRPVCGIVLTHRHWDHIDGLCAVADATGAPVAAGRADADAVQRPDADTLAKLHGYGDVTVDRRLSDGDEVVVGTASFSVVETPGHTVGSICLYCAEHGILLAGDTVFSGGRFGRTDFETGSMAAMEESLRRLARIVSDDATIYCGHEHSTTMARERKLNPHMS